MGWASLPIPGGRSVFPVWDNQRYWPLMQLSLSRTTGRYRKRLPSATQKQLQGAKPRMTHSRPPERKVLRYYQCKTARGERISGGVERRWWPLPWLSPGRKYRPRQRFVQRQQLRLFERATNPTPQEERTGPRERGAHPIPPLTAMDHKRHPRTPQGGA